MKLYNTLTHKKEEFVPMHVGKVNMYACGITVSGDAHIGHAKQAIIYDILRKYLQYKGYEVTYARNYTDVDDKIIAKANELGVNALVYANQKIKEIDKDMDELGVTRADKELRATEHIGDIIKITKGLIEKGHAYATPEGDVYFAVESDPNYGKLSNRKLKDMLTGVRIESEDNKRNPLDFALWKKVKEGEISWDSPWGKGRPGWHSECSAMNLTQFGDSIDIHGGGRDLIFPHHENEIAQSECYTGHNFAKYWSHNGLVKVNGQKMSKSLNNSITIRQLLDAYNPEIIRFALLQTNYKNDVNITDDLFPKAKEHLHGFYEILAKVDELGIVSNSENKDIIRDFEEGMDDDLNTAVVLANLFGYFKKMGEKLAKGDRSVVDDARTIRRLYSILGLFVSNPKEYLAKDSTVQENTSDIPQEVKELAEKRWQAKKERNFVLADDLRGKIAELGYEVLDKRDGYEIIKK